MLTIHDLEFLVSEEEVPILKRWCWFYHQLLLERSPREIHKITQQQQANPLFVLLESEIESIWQAIGDNNNWQPFIDFIELLGEQSR